MHLELDVETRSPVDLRTHGAYLYFASPHADVLMASCKLGDQRAMWLRGQPCPGFVRAHIEAGGKVKAHNANFERLAFNHVLGPKYDWPVPALEQFICTAATAAAMSLPRDLYGLGLALKLDVQKDPEGQRLIRKFCIPRKPKKGEDPNGLYWNEPEDYPDDFARFIAYCERDVDAEAAADARMVPLPDFELEAYWLDQRINDRGLRIDTISAAAAIELAEKAKELLDREMTIATGGYVTACSQVARLTDWVRQQGVDMASAAKADIEALLSADDLPAHVRRAIELRAEAAKTSVAKLTSFMERAGHDGRIRGAFLYHAAGTGRWSSIGAQLHNMPRPRKLYETAKLDTATLFEAFRTKDPAYLKTLYGDELGRTLWLLSDAIRGFIWAAPGCDIVQADYSGIEGAVAAWFCGEEWVLKALREINADPENVPDLYRRTAAGIFNVPVSDISKKDARRQLGKVANLALQYQGGVSAFYSMARGYGINMSEAYDPVWDASDGERREKAVARYQECLARNEASTQQLNREGWLAAELIKVGWRASNPAIAGSWRLLQDAVFEAVDHAGTVVSVLNAKFIVRHGFLWCRLPSGRCLGYGAPRIDEVEVQWADKTQPPEKREKQTAVTVMGVNSVTKKWERYPLYGGLVLENCLSADTKVMTPSGWKAIVDIKSTDLVWDGLEWVRHCGVIEQGVRNTIRIRGVGMTPDHKVWTNNGWRRAGGVDTAEIEIASPGYRSDGRSFWPVGCYQPGGRGVASFAPVRSATLHQPHSVGPVYDILNCGPRHRFAVLADDGSMFIVSNCVQAIARDLLLNGMQKAEAAGYSVIGHVHDEILSEVPRGFGNVKEFERLICELPAWAEGLPLTASGWRGKRYRKD